jgi:hypothetical protein
MEMKPWSMKPGRLALAVIPTLGIVVAVVVIGIRFRDLPIPEVSAIDSTRCEATGIRATLEEGTYGRQYWREQFFLLSQQIHELDLLPKQVARLDKLVPEERQRVDRLLQKLESRRMPNAVEAADPRIRFAIAHQAMSNEVQRCKWIAMEKGFRP